MKWRNVEGEDQGIYSSKMVRWQPWKAERLKKTNGWRGLGGEARDYLTPSMSGLLYALYSTSFSPSQSHLQADEPSLLRPIPSLNPNNNYSFCATSDPASSAAGKQWVHNAGRCIMMCVAALLSHVLQGCTSTLPSETWLVWAASAFSLFFSNILNRGCRALKPIGMSDKRKLAKESL